MRPFFITKFLVALFCLLTIGLISIGHSQTYFTHQRDHNQDFLVKVTLDCYCPTCCNVETIGPSRNWGKSLAMSQQGVLYGIDGNFGDLYSIDTLTGASTLVFDITDTRRLTGLIAMGSGLFYAFAGMDPQQLDTLIEINTVAMTYTVVGNLYPFASGDMCAYEGQIYYCKNEIISGFEQPGIGILNTAAPWHSQLLMPLYPQFKPAGIAPTNICHTLVGTDLEATDELILINIKDLVCSSLCTKNEGLGALASRQEYKSATICNHIDLDCNDSSLATVSDYNSDTITCLSNNPVPIADVDVFLAYDTVIETMTIRVAGFVPDGTHEILVNQGGIAAGVDMTGLGTGLVTLTNNGFGGGADFDYLLHHIFYDNTAPYPTQGDRTIEIQFTTAGGTTSIIAIANVPVIDLGQYPADLGPDLEICGAESQLLTVAYPGAKYLWSTGSTSSNIYATHPGFFSVLIYGNEFCPNRDTIFIDQLPLVEVELEGDDYVCAGEEPQLVINVNSTLEVDVQISTSTDSTFLLTGLSGFNSVTVPIDVGTEVTYTITNLVVGVEACIELTDSVHTIGAYPTYEIFLQDTICQGDSLLIGFEYEKVAGNYDRSFYTEAGCDSNVTVVLAVTPLPQLFRQSTSCDTSAVGVFLSFLPNATGCDTILQTTVTFQSSDTILINAGTCRLSDVGQKDTISLINLHGCDSIVITTLFYIPPADTIRIFVTSCDPNQLGVFTGLYTDATGCDSLVYTTFTQAPSDTTFISTSSCDPGDVGVFQTLLANQDGCDSLLITTVAFSGTDTIFASGTSCNPANVGVFETHFNGSDGCDSTVFTTVTFSDHDEVFLQSASCDPNATGVFVSTFVNQLGCDSIVTLTISLLPTHTVAIQSTTCTQSSAGVFVHNLVNQYGCDSTVTETITLLPSIQTSFSSTTCRSTDAGVFVNTFNAQNGCDSIVTQTVTLVPADTTTFSFNTCDPAEVGNIENTFINVDGCDSLVISTTSLFPLPQLNAEVTSNYHGFGISCFGESDGSVRANVNGTPPLTYLWSTGSPDQFLTGLAAGPYAITVIDGNGCETTSAVIIMQPPLLSANFDVNEPGCTGTSTGSISVTTSGGVSPIQYASNGNPFQSAAEFNSLQDGNYTITVKDANGCTVEETHQVDVPIRVTLDLGDNQVVESGEIVVVNALVNIPADSLLTIEWSGLDNPTCPNCLSQSITPLATTSYSVTVTSLDGCTAEDAITVFIGKKTDINVANIFSPNDDQQNDIVWITGGVDVKSISSWRIFDRWGNQVFNAENILPNDPASAWDGRWRGKAVHVGVYTFQLIAELKGGRQVIKYGDITLIR